MSDRRHNDNYCEIRIAHSDQPRYSSSGTPALAIGPRAFCFHQQHFELFEQPRPHQRKSYGAECRRILPNPLTVQYRCDPMMLDPAYPATGAASVTLLNALGIPFAPIVQNELVGGSQTALSIDGAGISASFSLKMHATSGGESVRLAFDVEWVGADGLRRRERVISHPFVVRGNVAIRRKDQ